MKLSVLQNSTDSSEVRHLTQLANNHNHQIIQLKTQLDDTKYHYILTNLGRVELLLILWLAEVDVASRLQASNSFTDVSDTEDMFTIVHLDHYDYSTQREHDINLEGIEIAFLNASESRFLVNSSSGSGVFKEFIFHLVKVILSLQLALGDQRPVFKLTSDFIEDLYQRARDAKLDDPQLQFLEENFLNKNQAYINKMTASVIPLLEIGEYEFKQVHRKVLQA